MTHKTIRKVGLSTFHNKLSIPFLLACREGGVDCVEVSQSEHFDDEVSMAEMAEMGRETGVHIWSYHLPFASHVAISLSNKTMRTQTLARYARRIKEAGDAGILHVIVHPSTEPIADCDRKDHLLRSADALNTLAEVAKGAGVTLCVEDLPRSCLGHSIEELSFLLSANSYLKMVFDSNHLLQGESHRDVLMAFADRIATLHLSDYDGIDERHWLPGEGIIDWPTVMDTLDEIGYSGPLMFEVPLRTPSSIIRARDLTPEDIRRCANELTERKPLTVLGTPHPKRGLWR